MLDYFKKKSLLIFFLLLIILTSGIKDKNSIFDEVLIEYYSKSKFKEDTLYIKLLVEISNNSSKNIFYPLRSSQRLIGLLIIDNSSTAKDKTSRDITIKPSNFLSDDFSVDTTIAIKPNEKTILIFEASRKMDKYKRRGLRINSDIILFCSEEIKAKVNSGECNFNCLNSYSNKLNDSVTRYRINADLRPEIVKD